VRALIVLALITQTAHADDFCRHTYRGTRIDLDVKDADLHDVLRLLADTGRVNLVVSDEVNGKVTLALKQVPWDQAACVIAATKKLHISIDGNILLVTTLAGAPVPHRQTTAKPN
jgi:type II secretory pathway component HofQ